PIVDARQIEPELLYAAAGNWIKEPHVLEARAALALAAVGNHDVIEGLVSAPAPRQANRDHDRIALIPGGRPKARAAQKRTRILRKPRFLRQFVEFPPDPGNPGGSPPLRAHTSRSRRPPILLLMPRSIAWNCSTSRVAS